MHYIPEDYWEKRLTTRFNLSGVGCFEFGRYYNKWLYKAKLTTLKKALVHLKINTYEKAVCDIGCGTGFFVDFYHAQKVKQIVGIDITDVSIENLKRKYPQYSFIKANISSSRLMAIVNFRFDILNVFDTLYHIVDDQAFIQAISNISNLTKQNGNIFISDGYSSQNVDAAAHVRFRSKDFYQKVLETNNIKILAVYPLYYFLNRTILGKLKVSSLQKLGLKCDKLCTSLYYYLDRIFSSEKRSNLKLIVAEKVK